MAEPPQTAKPPAEMAATVAEGKAAEESAAEALAGAWSPAGAETKAPASPYGGSSIATASTVAGAPGERDSSGSSSHVGPPLSVEEASSICRNVLRELSADVATVTISSSGRGWVIGKLEWTYTQAEEVRFSVVAVGPCRAFVGEVIEGPELFRKVPWRLKSVNGSCDFDSARLMRGDAMVLEGPTWATERFHAAPASPAPQQQAPAPVGDAAPKLLGRQTSHPSREPQEAPLSSDPQSPEGAQSVEAQQQSRAAESTPSRGFDVVPAGRPPQKGPVVPRLDLRGMQNQGRVPRHGEPGGLSVLCEGSCQQDQQAKSSEQNLGTKCMSLWNCMGGT